MATNRVEVSREILDRALQMYEPSLVVLSYSGGNDSAVSSHLAAAWATHHAHSTNVLSVSVDTLVSADGWRDFVRGAARQMRLPRHQIYETSMLDEWTHRAIENGIPYTRDQHKINFYYLKQNAFRRVVADWKKFRTDRVLFVNGVRRAESFARRSAAAFYRQGSMAHVQPIIHWSESDTQRYMLDNNLPNNPFYDRIGNSGDCMCNWHRQFDLQTVRRYAAGAYETLAKVDAGCREKWGYGYGDLPRPGTFGGGAVQMALPGIDDTPNLCRDCRKPQASNEARESVLMQRYEW